MFEIVLFGLFICLLPVLCLPLIVLAPIGILYFIIEGIRTEGIGFVIIFGLLCLILYYADFDGESKKPEPVTPPKDLRQPKLYVEAEKPKKKRQVKTQPALNPVVNQLLINRQIARKKNLLAKNSR